MPLHPLARRPERTVYVKRGHAKGAKDQAVAIAAALERDKPVALFPEGTTGAGTASAAVPLDPARGRELRRARTSTIRPVAIDYGDAARRGRLVATSRARPMSCGMLGRRGTLPVTVRCSTPLDRAGDRKQLAPRRATRSPKRSASTSRGRLAYRRGRNDSQDLPGQKLRLPDERL